MEERQRKALETFAARTGMPDREREILEKLVARAKPPPILYRYRKANDWALDEIRKQQLFAAKPDDLNDPFECSAPVAINRDSLREYFIEAFAPTRGLSPEQAAKEFDESPFEGIPEMIRGALRNIRDESGMICFSAVPNSIRMWSYYADSHKGICIGFDTTAGPFMAAIKVAYQNPELPLDLAQTLRVDASELGAHITLRKAAEWEFEQEYRIPVGPIGNRPRAFPFHPSAILQIRLGARITDDFKQRVIEVAASLPNVPKLIQMGCDFDRFLLTEEIITP
jgi:hypothetical protein